MYIYLQILMSVLTQVKITVALMPTALTPLEVMTAPARMDTQEMGTHVMVSFVYRRSLHYGAHVCTVDQK